MHTSDNDTRALPPPSPPSQPTIGAERDDQPKIRLGFRGSSPKEGHRVEISGLNSREGEQFEGAMHGHNWVTVSEYGRLRAIPTYKELPAPAEDEMMQQFWRPAMEGVETQLELFHIAPLPDFCVPSIIIQSLCGYNYSPEGYTREAQKLQRWGFECLRSRRNAAGRFHEMWVLSSFWSAQHELKDAIEAAVRNKPSGFRSKLQLDAAISFLCRHASFGTLDATNQRAAMTLDGGD